MISQNLAELHKNNRLNRENFIKEIEKRSRKKETPINLEITRLVENLAEKLKEAGLIQSKGEWTGIKSKSERLLEEKINGVQIDSGSILGKDLGEPSRKKGNGKEEKEIMKEGSKEAKGLNKLSTQDLDTNSVEIERKNEDLWAVANTDNTVNGVEKDFISTLDQENKKMQNGKGNSTKLTEHDLLRTENSKINLTIWDLPLGTRKEQIRRLLVSFGKVISCDLYWTYNGSGRAEVEICTSSAELDKKIKDTWALPFLGNRMVRVTSEGKCKNELKRRRKIVARVKGLPHFAAESLLWRQIARVGGKAVHIFRNSNGHQRGAALVEFESVENKLEAMRHCIWYNDIRLTWDVDFEKVELVEENSRKKRRVEVELKDLENPMGINLKRRGSNSFKPRIEIIGRKRIMPGRAEEERQDRERKNINKRVGTEQIYDQETLLLEIVSRLNKLEGNIEALRPLRS